MGWLIPTILLLVGFMFWRGSVMAGDRVVSLCRWVVAMFLLCVSVICSVTLVLN